MYKLCICKLCNSSAFSHRVEIGNYFSGHLKFFKNISLFKTVFQTRAIVPEVSRFSRMRGGPVIAITLHVRNIQKM